MRRVTPAVFAEQLTDRDRLLWQRFFARRGIAQTEVTEFTIDEDASEVVAEVVAPLQPGRFMLFDEKILRVKWHEIPLARRTQRRLPEL